MNQHKHRTHDVLKQFDKSLASQIVYKNEDKNNGGMIWAAVRIQKLVKGVQARARVAKLKCEANARKWAEKRKVETEK